MRSRYSFVPLLQTSLLVFTIAAPVQLLGQSSWKVKSQVEASSEYDDNVFLLPDSRKNDLSSPSAGATVSGRYTDMRSASDVVTTLGGWATFRGPGIAGRALEIQPELELSAYARNSTRRSVTLGLGFEQSLPHGSRARLRASATPSQFGRNYLVDAIDANADGMIESAERRYAAGNYREASVSADYRLRLKKSTKKAPFGAELQVGGGYYSRAYDAPLSGRNLSGPTADVRLFFDVTRRLNVDVGYSLEALSSSPASQIMVVDEADVGQDLNANATATDPNVRVAGTSDRSRNEHAASARAVVDLPVGWDFSVEYERRWRVYSSSEPLDFSYNGRRDARNQLGASVSRKLLPGLRLVARGEIASQTLDRGRDAGVGEIDDYSRHRFALGLRYGF